MKENLYFILNGKQLYLDKCLVEDEIPVFFSCVDQNNDHYIVLCVDMDMLRYIVVEVTDFCLLSMLRGKISMRDIFISQVSFWEVVSKSGDLNEDVVELKSIEQLMEEDLPEEGAYFSLYCDELKNYANKMEEDLLSGDFISITSKLGQDKYTAFSIAFDSLSMMIDSYNQSHRYQYNANILWGKTKNILYPDISYNVDNKGYCIDNQHFETCKASISFMKNKIA